MPTRQQVNETAVLCIFALVGLGLWFAVDHL
jgi:hypothetical protein